MTWSKVPDELAEYLDDATKRFDCEKKKMFGCPCYLVRGHIFAGTFQENVILHLDELDRRELFQDFDEASPFEPLAGRPMKEYAVIPAALAEDREILDEWLDRAYAFARSLPPKGARAARETKKAAKPKKTAVA